eukprot:4636101-Alexandrium_andersonii.AAC.1
MCIRDRVVPQRLRRLNVFGAGSSVGSSVCASPTRAPMFSGRAQALARVPMFLGRAPALARAPVPLRRTRAVARAP